METNIVIKTHSKHKQYKYHPYFIWSYILCVYLEENKFLNQYIDSWFLYVIIEVRKRKKKPH